ncbi:MAG: hypothetical protein H6601_00195 [Flavobacteriales bacterium]|nr:hypothetical protein [Flavobacteriales bacterium]
MFRFEKHVFFSALAVVLLAVGVCFRFFGDIILHADEFLFGAWGDGLKNYFTVAYQVIHGDGLWFNGMLYPFGDHIIFADGQPLLTKVLQFFIEPDVNNGPKIIAIMNLLMIGSLVITAWCVHRLLVWNYVGTWFAIPFSLTIAFLSPQVARFGGHYALGYTFVIPLGWLLIASFSRSKWPWLIAVLSSFFALGVGFLHPYYLFIFVIFLGAVLGWELIINRFQFAKVGQLIPRIFTLLVPLVLFMLYQHSVDPYTDRPTSPGGMFSHMATFQSVFTPVYDPFYNLFHSYFFRIFIPSSWEGNAYIGLVASFTAFASIFVLAKRAISRRWKLLTHPVLPPTLKDGLIPAIIVLLFAMGLFHRLGLHWLSDFISPIKQFRSLGRIAWVFYYVFSVWVVYHLYVLFRHFRSLHKGKYTYHITVVVTVCAFVWMLDAIVNIKYHKALMLNRNAVESFSNKYVSDWQAAGVNISDHQAILPLPMQLVGSEKIGLENGQKSLLHAMKGSFSSGLPIIGGAMSRTSLNVTEKTAQLVADSLFPRPILDEMRDDLKLLLLQSDEPLNREEQRLISLSQPVFSCNEYKLYSVSIDEIKYAYAEMVVIPDSVNYSEMNFLKPNCAEKIEDRLWTAETYRVESGCRFIDSTFQDSVLLNISYWVKVDPNEELLPNRVFDCNQEWRISGTIGSKPELLDGWLLVSENLQMEAGKHHVFMTDARPGTVSRIMLRNAEETVYHRSEDGTVFINNVPLR